MIGLNSCICILDSMKDDMVSNIPHFDIVMYINDLICTFMNTTAISCVDIVEVIVDVLT